METLNTIECLIFFLLVAAITLAICKRIHFPFTIALVIVGLLIGHSHLLGFGDLKNYINIKISPEIIMFTLLPTLIFESAFNLDATMLKRHIVPILSLAVVGLILSTFVIGIIIFYLSSFDLISSLLLGAILSATDPVAVVSIIKQLGAPKQLTILVEGESMFNDATAIVIAKLLFTILLTGAFSFSDLGHSTLYFFWALMGGLILGWLMSRLFGKMIGIIRNDLLIEISLTLILAYLSFILAQVVFHISGSMATVAAGIVIGGWGKTKISPEISSFLKEFWGYLGFLANAIIFLLVGLSVQLSAFSFQILTLIAILCAALLFARYLVIYGLIPIFSKLPTSPKISRSYQHVMFWGGLRGAIPLAIILSFGDFKYANEFLLLATGVVIFSLVVQGLTIEKLVNKLNLNKPTLTEKMNKVEGKLSTKKKVLEQFEQLQIGGLFSTRIAKEVMRKVNHDIDKILDELTQLQRELEDQSKEQQRLLLKSLSFLKIKFFKMFTDGFVSEESHRILDFIVDKKIEGIRFDNKTFYHYHIAENQEPIIQKAMYKLREVPYLKKYANRQIARRASSSYPVIWAQVQGCIDVLKHLEQESFSNTTTDKVRLFFQEWYDYTQQQLDNLAALYPEYVVDMQKKLAQNLILTTEKDMIKNQRIAGIISSGLAEELEEEINQSLYIVNKHQASSLRFDPNQYLRAIPFFQDLSYGALEAIKPLLEEKIYASNEFIITEGEKGSSLFLIMRGVVRVTKNIQGEEKNIATLVSGDFFGEMALLNDNLRTASCVTVTPSSLFKLERKAFEKIVEKHPQIQKAVQDVEQQRNQ